MSDQTIRILADLIGFVGFGGFLAILGWVWRLSRQIAKVETRAEAAEKESANAFSLAVQVKDDLNAFKIDAVRRFVTDETLARTEERIVDAVNRLAERLDRIIELSSSPRSRAPRT